MSEHDAEQRATSARIVAEHLANHPDQLAEMIRLAEEVGDAALCNTLASLAAVLEDRANLLRLLGEARSELGKLTTQYGACLYPGGPILLINADEIEPYRASGHYRIEQRVVGPWLPDAAEPQQPRHGPHKGQGDDTDAAATPGKTRQENAAQRRAGGGGET